MPSSAAAAAGVMLYGISLLAGVLGSAHLPTMAQRLADWLPRAAPAITPRPPCWCWAG